jgi:hypothetical protein
MTRGDEHEPESQGSSGWTIGCRETGGYNWDRFDGHCRRAGGPRRAIRRSGRARRSRREVATRTWTEKPARPPVRQPARRSIWTRMRSARISRTGAGFPTGVGVRSAVESIIVRSNSSSVPVPWPSPRSPLGLCRQDRDLDCYGPVPSIPTICHRAAISRLG